MNLQQQLEWMATGLQAEYDHCYGSNWHKADVYKAAAEALREAAEALKAVVALDDD
jgi:hypothetical protein